MGTEAGFKRRNWPEKFWPSMAPFLHSDLRWCVLNHEEFVHRAGGRKPSNRPVKAWADGRVRIEFLGTFRSAADAKRALMDRVACCDGDRDDGYPTDGPERNEEMRQQHDAR